MAEPGVLERQVADAIESAERCPRYITFTEMSCAGFDGCEDCLRSAARAALTVMREEQGL